MAETDWEQHDRDAAMSLTDDQVIVDALRVAIADAQHYGEYGGDPYLMGRYRELLARFEGSS